MSRVIDTLSLTVMPPPSSGMLRSMPKLDLLTCVAAEKPTRCPPRSSGLNPFDIAGDQITHIWAIRNPEKLRPWT
jgi:hypothetical protein